MGPSHAAPPQSAWRGFGAHVLLCFFFVPCPFSISLSHFFSFLLPLFPFLPSPSAAHVSECENKGRQHKTQAQTRHQKHTPHKKAGPEFRIAGDNTDSQGECRGTWEALPSPEGGAQFRRKYVVWDQRLFTAAWLTTLSLLFWPLPHPLSLSPPPLLALLGKPRPMRHACLVQESISTLLPAPQTHVPPQRLCGSPHFVHSTLFLLLLTVVVFGVSDRSAPRPTTDAQ